MDVRQDTYRVKSYHCGSDGSIRVNWLMLYLQESAVGHAEELGFGMERLGEIGSYWVLSNIRIELAEVPKWNDEITVRTWPSGHSRSIATREFVGEDKGGREVFRAGSEWMVLKKRTNRPRNLKRLGVELPGDEAKAIAGELARLEAREEYSYSERVRVGYSSIDLNGHVNNTEYVRWSMDALRRAFGLEGAVRSVQATYFSEVFEGDEVELLACSGAGGRFDVLGRRAADGTDVYAAEVVC